MTQTQATDPGTGVVVCGVDGTDDALRVIAAASATAGRVRAPLLLAHVVRSTWDCRVPAFGLEDTTPRVVVYGAPGPRLLSVAESRGAGLIVVGSRNLGRLRGRFYNRVSRYLARRARCPVMIVPGSADPASPQTGTHVVCVLESDRDERVLREAMALARRLTAGLVVVVDASGITNDAARALLGRVRADGVEVQTRAVPGGATGAVAAASEDAAAVVVRLPGRWERDGSTPSELAGIAPVPVVLVPRSA
jgi:nucleotide-binding universal stress UspA family protein